MRARIKYGLASSVLIAVLFLIGRLHENAKHVLAASASEPQPVLVELFTSEGCSSCPPADELLAKLDATQPLPGVRFIVLSEHVTYWDRQGWRDPFSQDAFTQRQKDYAQRFHLDDVYTPQVVVDGSAQLVGNDEQDLRRKVIQSAENAKTPLQIDTLESQPHTLFFTAKWEHAPGRAHLWAALAADEEHSSVTSGENKGRTLRHVAVVKDMHDFGEASRSKQPLRFEVKHFDSSRGVNPTGNQRLVVFLADPSSGRVSGVAEKPLPRQ